MEEREVQNSAKQMDYFLLSSREQKNYSMESLQRTFERGFIFLSFVDEIHHFKKMID